jgi:hypothetical protein
MIVIKPKKVDLVLQCEPGNMASVISMLQNQIVRMRYELLF